MPCYTSGARRDLWVPSSSGLGHHPLKVETRVRTPLGLLGNGQVRARTVPGQQSRLVLVPICPPADRPTSRNAHAELVRTPWVGARTSWLSSFRTLHARSSDQDGRPGRRKYM